MMTKDNTSALKGWAILMMMYLHLFIGWRGYNSIFLISQTPIENHFVRFSNLCVHIFVFLSGYGLLLSEKSKYVDQIKRISRLYTIFIPIFLLGSILLIYNGRSFVTEEFILNGLCISHSYNNHWWFLPMYFILLLFFPVLKKSMKYPLITIIVLLMLKILGKYWLAKWELYDEYNIFDCCLFIIYVSTAYMAVFYSGMICSKGTTISEYYKKYMGFVNSNRLLNIIIVLLMVLITDTVPNHGILSFILVPILLPALLNIAKGEIMKKLGELSVFIWLSHHFLLLYIRDFLHVIGYSLIIYPLFVLYCVLLALFCKRVIQF